MSKLLNYLQENFKINNPGDVIWSHAVNNKTKLEKYLADKEVMIIESDIRLSKTGDIVCAHPPETESDLQFITLVEQISKTNKGLKLDFKDPEILIPCLNILAKEKLIQPVILNADILHGNGANIAKFSPAGFITLCKKYFPQGILSLGWTTTADTNNSYTKENVDNMLNLVSDLSEVTFPIRACLMPKSKEQLFSLLTKTDFTLTIWNNEPVDEELRNWIKENTNRKNTYYDFINADKESIRLW
jgi:hypothetical protein